MPTDHRTSPPMPTQVSSGLLFGAMSCPVPDIDRAHLLVLMGTDPYESNGSLWTAPDLRGRIERCGPAAAASS